MPFWIAGLLALFRRPGWRVIRFIGIAFPVLVLLVFIAGSQFYYPFGLESVISLPLIPVTLVGETPIPAINQTQRDQVGWPQYPRQVDAVARSVVQGDVVVLASN